MIVANMRTEGQSADDRLALVNIDGTNPRILATGATHPAWTPDGTGIVFTSTTGDDTQLHRVAADGSDEAAPSAVSTQGANAAWSDFAPDGDTLVYTAEQSNGTRAVFVGAVDGGNVAQLDVGDGLRDIGAPRFSSDGTKITFTARSNSQYAEGEPLLRDIYVANRDGSHVRKLSTDDDAYGTPEISPDGTTVVSSRRAVQILDQGFGYSVVLGRARLWINDVSGPNTSALGLDGTDPSYGRRGGAIASGISPLDGLNPKEKAFCYTPGHGYFCQLIDGDRDKALRLAGRLFTGHPDDDTMANAFQHSYWTGLMTHSAKHLGLNVLLASRFATLHEYDDSGKPRWKSRNAEGNSSRMDLHNNDVGWYYVTYKVPYARNEHFICSGILDHVRAGRRVAPSQAGRVGRQLYWYRGVDRHRPPTAVHIAGSRLPDRECG
jgi:hypothetical protein